MYFLEGIVVAVATELLLLALFSVALPLQLSVGPAHSALPDTDPGMTFGPITSDRAGMGSEEVWVPDIADRRGYGKPGP